MAFRPFLFLYNMGQFIFAVAIIFYLPLCSSQNLNNIYKWERFNQYHKNDLSPVDGHLNAKYGSERLQDQQVYISLTSMSSRIHLVPNTVNSLLEGTLLPNHIFIFVSEEPFMLDRGITPDVLLQNKNWTSILAHPSVSVVFTNNIGPHRKLLPLLERKWDEDCIIITVDDDEIYPATTLEDLISYYLISDRNSVVALRARRFGLCADAPPWRLAPYPRRGRWPVPSGGRHEMLLLPTGVGGVLYRPRFFHPVVFDEELRRLTVTGDDLMFRLATMANNTLIVAACSPGKYDCPEKPRILEVQPPLKPELKLRKIAGWNSTVFSSSESSSHHHNHRAPDKNPLGSSPSQDLEGGNKGENRNLVDQYTYQYESTTQSETHTQYEYYLKTITYKKKSRSRNNNVNKNKALRYDYYIPEDDLYRNRRHLRHRVNNRFGVTEEFSNRKNADPYQETVTDTNNPETQLTASRGESSTAVSSPVVGRVNGPTDAYRYISEYHSSPTRPPSTNTVSSSGSSASEQPKSLANDVNSNGGNDFMWAEAVKYLQAKGILDFEALLQVYAPRERASCMIHSAYRRDRKQNPPHFLNNIMEKMKSTFQTVYDPRCGVQYCPIEG